MKECIVPRLPDKVEPIGPGIRDFSVSGVGTDTGTGLPPAAVEKYTNDEPAEQN
jgi:hypothetical protein